MELSIIVPVYNAEKYLCKCIDSILEQSVKDFELILVNDGSPDGSWEIMERYRNEYPSIIKTISLENGGQGRARNVGLSIAQGEFIGFVDSDDYIDPSMYKKLLDCAKSNDADIAVCSIKRVFDNGNEDVYVSWNRDLPLYAAGSCCDKIFRRELIGDVRYPEGLWYEDFSFSAKMIMSTPKIAYVDEGLYIYRCGQLSTMNNNNTLKNLDILSIMKDLKDFADANAADGFEYLLINHVLLDAINRVGSHDTTDRETVIEKLRNYVRECIPNLFSCESYKNESRNRRIIMALNYYGLHKLARTILSIKK